MSYKRKKKLTKERCTDKPFIDEKRKLFFREGKITYLRPLLKSDLRLEYLAWLNDPNLNKYSSHFRSWPTLEKDLEDFYINNLKNNKCQISDFILL